MSVVTQIYKCRGPHIRLHRTCAEKGVNRVVFSRPHGGLISHTVRFDWKGRLHLLHLNPCKYCCDVIVIFTLECLELKSFLSSCRQKMHNYCQEITICTRKEKENIGMSKNDNFELYKSELRGCTDSADQ